MPLVVENDPTLNVIALLILFIAFIIFFGLIFKSFFSWFLRTNEIIKLLTQIADKLGVDTRTELEKKYDKDSKDDVKT